MKKLSIFFLMIAGMQVMAQQQKTKNLVVVTLDGYRWKELFTGADEELINNKAFIKQKDVKDKYWRNTPEERRKVLMPFFWSTIAAKGQLYGNRTVGNNMNVKNPYWFSYPGYNEMFTGYPDTIVNSNDYPPNPNVNVFEFINKQPAYQGKVAVFAGWNAYYRILNEKRSGLPINAGWTEFKGPNITETQKFLNWQQQFVPQIYGPDERIDAVTYPMAKEYLKQNHPKVLYLAFIDTDAFGHQGKYDLYLDAAHRTDTFIGDLWNYLQSDPFYKDQTTLLVTTDHGRGDGASWKSHKRSIPHCDEVWLAAIGPDSKALGEVRQSGQLYQNQIAKTIGRLIGLDFTTKNPMGEPIESILKK
ncbi:LTA synthase family protein [Pedobacter sp. BS3]|uniref:alkaline phosphatase family protein n=1 Tax=Pedobacter sp. BS3 TaxID=2567937 RepID=UPI0011ED4E26|nr:alkaline phosphatase family protein [Pedobacter sp. BS3]TZF83175.1 LTA synthase family protein [Pedobacter sp. BS3]